MMAAGSSTYRCSPTIDWVKDAGLTLLVRADDRRAWSLYGVEAAIWDLLVLSYPFHKVVHLLSILLACTTGEAEEILATTLEEWETKGIVNAVEESKGG